MSESLSSGAEVITIGVTGAVKAGETRARNPADACCCLMPDEHYIERASVTGGTAEASLEEFLTFERLLADLSARFADASIVQVETEIDSALNHLQEFLGFRSQQLLRIYCRRLGHYLRFGCQTRGANDSRSAQHRPS